MECANSIFASYTYKVGKCIYTLTFLKVSSNPGDESSPKGTEKKNAQAKLFVNLAATLGIHCLPMLSARLLCIRGPAEIKIIWLSQKSNRAGKLLSSTRTILPYKLLIE